MPHLRFLLSLYAACLQASEQYLVNGLDELNSVMQCVYLQMCW